MVQSTELIQYMKVRCDLITSWNQEMGGKKMELIQYSRDICVQLILDCQGTVGATLIGLGTVRRKWHP